ncbi:response regulator [Thermosulfurimonas sp. F29]|uniref:response regulator n=1 Tax=Thermosulfurimonas sp. F29 TaxID=2867247 RepID=UPI001C8360CD|nr:response regulator [Thermosulfurimonas sp. F29]MBX6422391.1 response regulator [Thermosulfurimonas sp. F29]
MKKVLIIDDSPLICRLLEKAILSFPGFIPVGKAANGVEALNLIEKVDPDLCTLDVNMPAMDGLSLLKKLMVRKPMPVLMVSALTKEGSRIAFESLRYGALDFLPKPGGLWERGGEFEKIFCEKLKRVASVELENIRLIPRGSLCKRSLLTAAPARSLIVGLGKEGSYTLILRLIQYLEEIRTAQLWCLGLPERLIEAFAEYLSEGLDLPVKMLEEGESLREGFIYLMGTEHWWRFFETGGGELQAEKVPIPPGVTGEDLFDALLLELSTLLGPGIMALVGSGRFEKGKVGLAEIRNMGGEVLVIHRRHCLYPEAPIYFAEGGGYPELPLEKVAKLLSFWPGRRGKDGLRAEGAD